MFESFMKKIRIGFLSTADIGRKNWKAIFNSGNCVVSAVASRELGRSRDFIRDCQAKHAFDQVPAAMGSYDELLNSPDVDAVYIPLPTGLRKEFVIRAAAAGKHVLCEKPCAVNAADLAEMQSACRRHAVQFLDGVMFMHNPRLLRVRELLDDSQSVGAIRRIASAFSFYPGEEYFRTNIRAHGVLEPTGCLGDLGWYCIRFALWTLRWQLPESVAGRILSEAEHLPGRPGAPTEFAATLYYPGGVTMEFYCSFRAAYQNWVHVSGQKGWLRLPDFVHPLNTYEPVIEVGHKAITVETGVKCPAGADVGEMGHAGAQDARMWRNFSDQILSGKLNEEWPHWSMQTQRVLDACHESAKQGRAVTLS
jgi:predicted dehydrogenase